MSLWVYKFMNLYVDESSHSLCNLVPSSPRYLVTLLTRKLTNSKTYQLKNSN